VSARARLLVPSMGKGSCTFKKSDFVRAVEAAREAKLEIARVEVSKDGSIVIIVASGNGATASEGNEWDEVISR